MTFGHLARSHSRARFFDRGAVIFSNDPDGETVADADLKKLTGYAGPYRRFRGTQDPAVNNGQQFDSHTLKGRVTAKGAVVGDAILLIK